MAPPPPSAPPAAPPSAGGGGALNAAAAMPPQPMYGFSSNVYNVYYPPTAFGFQVPGAGGAAGGVAAASTSKQLIMESVKKQIDYYFSVDNLCKDIFLRSKVGSCMPLSPLKNQATGYLCVFFLFFFWSNFILLLLAIAPFPLHYRPSP